MVVGSIKLLVQTISKSPDICMHAHLTRSQRGQRGHETSALIHIRKQPSFNFSTEGRARSQGFMWPVRRMWISLGWYQSWIPFHLHWQLEAQTVCLLHPCPLLSSLTKTTGSCLKVFLKWKRCKLLFLTSGWQQKHFQLNYCCHRHWLQLQPQHNCYRCNLRYIFTV